MKQDCKPRKIVSHILRAISTMHTSEVVEQLKMFVGNLVQVTPVLYSLSGTKLEALSALDRTATEGSIKQMNEAKSSLLDTVVLLNQLLISQATSSQIFDVYIGSLVLAPRFFRGSLCWDLAVITKIEQNCRPILTTTSIITQLDTYSLLTCEPGSEVEVTISVLWLRPQTTYEHFSHSINFLPAQLRHTQEAVQYYQEQQEALSIVQPDQEVMFLSTDYTAPQAGVWCHARVSNVSFLNSAAPTVTLLPVLGRSASSSSASSVIIPLQISQVTLLPRSTTHKTTTLNSTTTTTTTSKTQSAHKCSLYSDSESDTEEQYEGITSLPSYSEQHHSRMASNNSLNNLHANTLNGVPGVWEKHTKGKLYLYLLLKYSSC